MTPSDYNLLQYAIDKHRVQMLTFLVTYMKNDDIFNIENMFLELHVPLIPVLMEKIHSCCS